MKKLLAGTLTAAFALGLTACGQQRSALPNPSSTSIQSRKRRFPYRWDYAGAHRDLSGV